MGNWGDDVDYEAQEMKDFKVRFTINFKKIFHYVGEVSERTLEVTDKHPKDSLMKLWGGTMVGLFPFFILSYQILLLVTLPFIVLYFLTLIRIFKCWKSFRYNPVTFWLMSFFTMAGMLAAAVGLQQLILNFLN